MGEAFVPGSFPFESTPVKENRQFSGHDVNSSHTWECIPADPTAVKKSHASSQ